MDLYKDMLRKVLIRGLPSENRTGTGTISRFGMQTRFNLDQRAFPLVTGKFTSIKITAVELMWFLRADQDEPGSIDFLHDHGVKIWDEWALPDGSFGPIYGVQWRSWPRSAHGSGTVAGYIDQLNTVIKQIKRNPDSRRLIVTAWNPAQIDQMVLPPCHMMFQFSVKNGKLSTHVYQRSADMFLGVPYNIASYSLLTHIIANICELKLGELIWTGGDCHIYKNHIDQVSEYLKRPTHALPHLRLKRKLQRLEDFSLDDIELKNYAHEKPIKAPIAV